MYITMTMRENSKRAITSYAHMAQYPKLFKSQYSEGPKKGNISLILDG